LPINLQERPSEAILSRYLVFFESYLQ
jgi:hypothetical protein